MAKYKFTRTGAVINSTYPITGEGWEPVKAPTPVGASTAPAAPAAGTTGGTSTGAKKTPAKKPAKKTASKGGKKK